MSKKTKVKKGKLGGSPVGATVCSFCERVYIFPCNGERYECANAVWKRSKGRVDVTRLTEDERAKLAKTGKIPNVNTNERKQSQAEPKKVKRKRVRL